MTDASPRLALPFLIPGQAQKELFHNEALLRLDIAVQACVVAAGLDAPPAAPAPGQCWIVGANPVGDWSGQAGAIAGRSADGWRFVAPREGLAAWNMARGEVVRFAAGAWTGGRIAGARLVIDGTPVVGAQRLAIAAAAGGDVVDQQARAAIAAILDSLRAHGLIAG